MKQHSFTSHTPEEMRQLSNLGHIVEGALFAIVGLLALLSKLDAFTWASSAGLFWFSSQAYCCCFCFTRATRSPIGRSFGATRNSASSRSSLLQSP